jgi:hypothetical protein
MVHLNEMAESASLDLETILNILYLAWQGEEKHPDDKLQQLLAFLVFINFILERLKDTESEFLVPD